jgi:hypothetical protein
MNRCLEIESVVGMKWTAFLNLLTEAEERRREVSLTISPAVRIGDRRYCKALAQKGLTITITFFFSSGWFVFSNHTLGRFQQIHFRAEEC